MPLTPDMTQKVEQIRDYLFGGGYPNPLSNAEQLSFLFFFYLFEQIDEDNVVLAEEYGREYTSAYVGEWKLRNPLNAAEKGQETLPKERMRWSIWARGLNGEPLVRWLRDEVFPFYAEIAEKSAMNFMDGARLSVDEPTVLTQVVSKIDELRLDREDGDTKGDLFEHVLRQIKTAGELGQFRTPRHVIRAIVEMIDPKLGETVYDPAAGTAGFLVAAYNHIRLAHSSPDATETAELDGKPVKRGWGDKLSNAMETKLSNETFYGNDVDPQMVRLSTMNLTLRGLSNVHILKRNALTTYLERNERAELGLPLDGFDVILANPPFAGKLDRDRIVDEVRIGSTTATEILFLKYMMDSLKEGGRCGVIVPEGVLFGSTSSHKELRRQLIENNTVEAVMSLPGGVFQPYSGVKTSVLFFKRGGKTENVFFLHVDDDGYRMDANHNTVVEADDLPNLATAYVEREENLKTWQQRDAEEQWEQKWWFANADEIRTKDFDLSAGKYRPQSLSQVEHRNPLELLDELKAIEMEILKEVDELSEKLRDFEQ
jgi:type I restriction enzyme M protein